MHAQFTTVPFIRFNNEEDIVVFCRNFFLFFECISQQISFFDKGVKVTIVNQTCNSLGDGSLEIMLANPLGVIESIVYDTELNTLLQ